MARYLDLHALGRGPFEMLVHGDSNALTVKDVVIGDVWACTGQSNMAFPLAPFPISKEEIPRSANPMLRQFLVTMKTSPVPVEEAAGKWTVAGPATTGSFTAVGYFFGKQLQKELGIPIGLLNDSVGGTVIETWMSPEALAVDPETKTGAEKALHDRAVFDHYADQYLAWQKKYDRLDHPTKDVAAYNGVDVDTSAWKPVSLPTLFSKSGLPDAGAVWIRRKIPAPSPPDIKPDHGIDMYLGDIRDTDTVYFNGRQIGQGDILAVEHRYGVRYNYVLAGDNTIAVRIFNPADGLGILLTGKNRLTANHFTLTGEWLAKTEFELSPLEPAAKAELPVRPAVPIDPQNVASYLYNGMIHPVIPYGIKGIIWYQGEGNAFRGYQYRAEFPALITDWRAKWGRPDLPFYYCQIANFMAHSPRPEESITRRSARRN